MFGLNTISNDLLGRIDLNKISSQDPLSLTLKKTAIVAVLAFTTLSLGTYCFGKVGLLVTSVVVLGSVILSETALVRFISSLTEFDQDAISKAIAGTITLASEHRYVYSESSDSSIYKNNSTYFVATFEQVKKNITKVFQNPQKFVQKGLDIWLWGEKAGVRLVFGVKKEENVPVFKLRLEKKSKEIFNYEGPLEAFVAVSESKRALVDVPIEMPETLQKTDDYKEDFKKGWEEPLPSDKKKDMQDVRQRLLDENENPYAIFDEEDLY